MIITSDPDNGFITKTPRVPHAPYTDGHHRHMRIRRVVACTLLATGLTLATVACEHTDNGRSDAGSSASEDSGSSDSGDSGQDGESDGQGGKSDAKSAPVPRLVGQGLRSAQDAAADAGFTKVTTHDALGRDRAQAFSRNWQVCFQEPESGAHPTDTKIDLGAVKTDEECPAKDDRPEKASSTMPDFTGKSLRAARNSLDSSTSIQTEDAGASDRIILLESNWQVCAQSPKPGTKVAGQPVTLKAVKFDEKCP